MSPSSQKIVSIALYCIPKFFINFTSHPLPPTKSTRPASERITCFCFIYRFSPRCHPSPVRYSELPFIHSQPLLETPPCQQHAHS